MAQYGDRSGKLAVTFGGAGVETVTEEFDTVLTAIGRRFACVSSAGC